MKLMKLSLFIILTVISVLLGAAGGYLYWSFSDLPEVRTLETYTPLQSSFIYSADGRVLAELFLERRSYIPHYKIPDRLKKAFISIEDHRFYSHPGVDIMGILRALYKDIKAQSIVQGGSTITQQLSKMLFLRPERSLHRKVKEALISIQIEKRYTKDEILGMYLNQTYFGTRAYGIEAAAQTYFGKAVIDLDLPEIALIAGLQKAPSQYSPFRNPEKAKMRRQLVLDSMLTHGFITQSEYESAKTSPIPTRPHYRKYEPPYFVEFLRQQIESRYGDTIYTSGFRIHSTIDYSLQKLAEESVRTGIAAIEKRVKHGIQAALVAIDLRTGAVRAMVGGNDFWETQFNRAVMAMRQPGSSFKPFVYATAIEQGLTPDDIVLDAPISFKGAKPNSLWSPKNYDNEFRGPVPLRTAIALSLNVATVRLANQTGIKEIIETAKKCGITSTMAPYLPLALGASDVTLYELTDAYAAFATGKRIAPMTYDRILNRDGVVLEEKTPLLEEVFEPETVEAMKDILRAVVERGTARRALELDRVVYGKTGTTNDFSDAWFVGFDDSMVVGVWVGRDDHTPIGPKEAGGRAALPIWIDFMKGL